MDIKEKLQKQLQLLSERSVECHDMNELAKATEAMVSCAELLDAMTQNSLSGPINLDSFVDGLASGTREALELTNCGTHEGVQS